MEKRKRDITSILFILVAVILLGANIASGLLLMEQSENAMKNLMQNRMLDISNTAAYMIDGDALEAITGRDESNSDYMKIYNTLDSFQRNIDLEFIYGIKKIDEETYIFTIDPAPVDCSEYGELVHYTDALGRAFTGAPSVDDEPYTDNYGRFYSAYTPVYNSKGDVVGVIAVDFSAEWVDKQLLKNALTVMAGVIISMLIGAVVMVFVRIRILRGKLRDSNEQANAMITAMASDYRSVYYVNLDDDQGICYREHSNLDNGLNQGEKFRYLETFSKYANDYVTEEYKEQFLQFIDPASIRAALKSDALIALTYLVKRNGVESYEMLRMAGVRRPEDRDDNTVHAIGIGFTDVDARTRENLEQKQALANALAQAEEANKAKTAFLSSMSHELRTPMNAIIGLNRIAMSDSNISDKTKDYLEQIGSSASHLLKIINDILDMSSIESGHMTIKNEEFSFARLTEEVSAMIGVECYEKGIKYQQEIDEELKRYFVGDDMKLKQIMINVLGNSVKFTEKDGVVSFKAEKINDYDQKTSIRLTMKDTGIGMDEAYIAKIFEPFSQEDISNTNKHGSTGLGMAITKNYVDMLGGTIDIQSKKGVGTTITVTLTLENSDTVGGKEETLVIESEKKILDGCRVLLAEDILVNAKIMMKILSMRNIVTDHAENGKIAVDMFGKSQEGYYDAILMDMRMPEMDGLEATAIIRNMPRSDAKHIPIIAVTANAFDEDVRNSMQAGLNAHISKPVEPNEIYKVLESFISAKD